jgi:hypothetical protein
MPNSKISSQSPLGYLALHIDNLQIINITHPNAFSSCMIC